MATPSAQGFAFEELVGRTLEQLLPPLREKGYQTLKLLTEQDIRDLFQEQSLNGVDHMLELVDPSGAIVRFLIQEKWKLVTNQREVSQFLDCCARILSRIRPELRGTTHRLWVTRSQPSANGDKSLLEGGAYTIQCMTSPTLLAQITGQFICELLRDRSLAGPMIASMPSLLPEECPLEPEVLDNSKLAPGTPLTSKIRVNVMKQD